MLGRLGDKYGLPKLNTRLAASHFARRCFDRYSQQAVDEADPAGVGLPLRTAKAFERVAPEIVQHPE